MTILNDLSPELQFLLVGLWYLGGYYLLFCKKDEKEKVS